MSKRQRQVQLKSLFILPLVILSSPAEAAGGMIQMTGRTLQKTESDPFFCHSDYICFPPVTDSKNPMAGLGVAMTFF